MKNIINKIKTAVCNWFGVGAEARVLYGILSKKIYKLDNATTEEIESLKNKIEMLEREVERNFEWLTDDIERVNNELPPHLEGDIDEINKRINWAENEIKYNHMEHLALKEVYNKYIMQLDNVDYFDYNHETAEDIKPKYKDVENKYDYEHQMAAIKPLKKTAAKKAPAKKTAAKKR